jgi:2-polyprenyl-6-methoxyphenol hydroxylase-like FAD-dependent oxidoreductase
MTSILIAGAGIGGLSLVRALRGQKCVIEIAERSQVFDPVGVGIVLHPNGLEALAQLGLLDAIKGTSNVIARLEVVRDDATLSIPFCEVWDGAMHATRAVLRSDLHHVLWRGALEAGHHNIRWRMGCRVVGVESNEPCPIALFEDGSRKSYDLIVGADGVHSPIRRTMLPESAAVPANLFYLRWLAENVIGLETDAWRTIERPDCAYGFIPVGRNRLHCFVQLTTAEDPCLKGEEVPWLEKTFARGSDALLATLQARCGPIHAGFAWTVYPLQWGVGRCVLMGDSAHAISPTLSQGGSLAIEDALVLADALRRSDSVTEAIEVYRAVRQERVAWILRMSLAQLNSLRRRRSMGQTRSEMATSYLRHLYAPLRFNPLPDQTAVSFKENSESAKA